MSVGNCLGKEQLNLITIGELLKILMDRQGLDQTKFAAILGVTRVHLNGVIRNRPGYKGSIDLVAKALEHAKLQWSDVLCAPIDEDTVDEDAQLLSFAKKLISHGGADRADLKDALDWIRRSQQRRQKTEPSGPAPKPPKRPRERNVVAA